MTGPGRRAALAGLVLATALLAACPPNETPPPQDALTDPAAVIALTDSRGPGPSSVAVEARATQYSDRGAIKGKLAILVRDPAAVHFSMLSPTDDVVGVLATDGKRFSSFERGAKVCYVGDACPENVGRMLPIAIEPAALAKVLVGRPPLIPHAGRTVAWDGRAGAYRLELEGQGGVTQRAWVTHGDGRIKRVQLIEAGRVTVDLAYADWATVSGELLPHALDIKMDRGNVDLQLRYREVDVGLELKDSAFAIPCPGGTTIEELPCTGSGVFGGAGAEVSP